MLTIGRLSIDSASQAAFVAGRDANLTGKEFQIVELLAHRRGEVQTKPAIMAHLYGGDSEPDSKIVDVFMCKLRRKLRLAGDVGTIETIWGRGYSIAA